MIFNKFKFREGSAIDQSKHASLDLWTFFYPKAIVTVNTALKNTTLKDCEFHWQYFEQCGIVLFFLHAAYFFLHKCNILILSKKFDIPTLLHKIFIYFKRVFFLIMLFGLCMCSTTHACLNLCMCVHACVFNVTIFCTFNFFCWTTS